MHSCMLPRSSESRGRWRDEVESSLPTGPCSFFTVKCWGIIDLVSYLNIFKIVITWMITHLVCFLRER